MVIAVMPYARNRGDGCRIYFEDDGGDGAAVVLHGGFLDSVGLTRDSSIAEALPADEFRLIYVDHRGLGRSDKPHEPDDYAVRLRVADAVAVLDEIGIERAHFIGLSWGGRLAFGIGEHAPDRVRSLVVGGQQPYAWPDSPLSRIVTGALAKARTQGIEALVEAFEAFWDLRFPDPVRARYLENDAVALAAAWSAARNEGAISEELRTWQFPCLVFMGAGDADFLDQARRAADEIPKATFLLLERADHYAAHTSQDEVLRGAVLRTLRADG